MAEGGQVGLQARLHRDQRSQGAVRPLQQLGDEQVFLLRIRRLRRSQVVGLQPARPQHQVGQGPRRGQQDGEGDRSGSGVGEDDGGVRRPRRQVRRVQDALFQLAVPGLAARPGHRQHVKRAGGQVLQGDRGRGRVPTARELDPAADRRRVGQQPGQPVVQARLERASHRARVGPVAADRPVTAEHQQYPVADVDAAAWGGQEFRLGRPVAAGGGVEQAAGARTVAAHHLEHAFGHRQVADRVHHVVELAQHLHRPRLIGLGGGQPRAPGSAQVQPVPGPRILERDSVHHVGGADEARGLGRVGIGDRRRERKSIAKGGDEGVQAAVVQPLFEVEPEQRPQPLPLAHTVQVPDRTPDPVRRDVQVDEIAAAAVGVAQIAAPENRCESGLLGRGRLDVTRAVPGAGRGLQVFDVAVAADQDPARRPLPGPVQDGVGQAAGPGIQPGAAGVERLGEEPVQLRRGQAGEGVEAGFEG